MDIEDIKNDLKDLTPLAPGKGESMDQVEAPKYIAEFDSAWAMLKALANCMVGKDFPGLGALPGAKPIEAVVGSLNRRLGQRVYALAGWSETVSADEIRSIRAEEISKAVLGVYPDVSDQAEMIGSANGALIHLCAALRAAWLPQTFLIPLRRPHIDPDDITADMEWGRTRGAILLKNNPELALYHMHDPDHDRLMVRRMAYFRIKRRTLGETYRRFIEEKVRAGATIYIVECGLKWPTMKIDDRHFFQTGGGGGVPPEEYLNGSERVSRFLETQGSSVRKWDPPQPDSESPEAEWGFDAALREEIIELVRKLGGRVVRVLFDEPEDLSPLVADFHRWWYRDTGVSPDHMLAESFAFVSPYWVLRTRSVPYWALFSGRKSAEHLLEYLDRVDPYQYIYIMLLSNGMDPVEGVSIEDWRAVLRRATVRGEFVGVDEKKFPYDFASFLRYNTDLQEQIPFRYEMPSHISLEHFETFLKAHGQRYNVTFQEVS
mgnify:FL=1